MERLRLTGISTRAFVTEGDRKALDALERLPLLPKVVRKFYELGFDRWLYVHNLGRAVRLGPRQCPTLYNIHREACGVLDMPEPELYLSNNPFTNAFAGGVERPYIMLRSSIVDALTDEELYHLIGHELGHIKSGHILYFSVAQFLVPLLEAVGRRTMGLGDAAAIGLVMAFAEWSRQAEVSADRAGLLVAQSPETSIQANLKLCAGPNRLSHELSMNAFLDQARAYRDTDTIDSVAKMVWFYLMNWQASHPLFVHRAHELDRWVASGQYQRIMDGMYPRDQVA